MQNLVHCRFDAIIATGEKEAAAAAQSHDASRIFGCWWRCARRKQLADLCMMKHARVKKVMYRMLADRIVEIEYIPRTADRDPKKSLFLWSRLDAASQAGSALDVTGVLENDDSHKSSAQGKTRWRKLCAAFEHLALSIHKLDQVALHRDF